VLGIATFAFLIVGDVESGPVTVWHASRLICLGAVALAALLLATRRGAARRGLRQPPLLFFTIFAVVMLVECPFGLAPASALRYALGYVALVVVAAVLASVFSVRGLLVGLLGTLLVKVVCALALGWMPLGWWHGERLGGVSGNPNPLGVIAGLGYLLIVLEFWRDDFSRRASAASIGAALACTIALSLTRSYSATVATAVTLAALAWPAWRRARTWGHRVSWLVIALALLAPLGVSAAVQRQRSSTAGDAVRIRSEQWVRLERAVQRRPWIGYGAGSTPLLAPVGGPDYATSAHNLYLEASVYAGVPGGLVMLLFVTSALAMALWSAYRRRDDGALGVAAVIVFYAAVAPVQPVVLNSEPSSLVAVLVAAAVCAAAGPRGESVGSGRSTEPDGRVPAAGASLT
jgi:O-antigen ligase